MADDGTGGASAAEARAFAAAVQSLLAWVHAPENGERNEVAALVREVLGEAGEAESVVTRQLPPFEHVNLQTALDAWSTEPGRRVEVRGVAIPPHYGGITLQQLVSGEALPPLRLSARSVWWISPTGRTRRWPAWGWRSCSSPTPWAGTC